MMTVRRIFLLSGIATLPLCSLLSQLPPQAEGNAAINKLLRAFGGSAKVNAVKTLRQRVIVVRQGQQFEIDQSIVYPDKQVQKISLPQGKLLRVVSPTVAFTVIGTQVLDLPPIERTSSRVALKHDFINVLQHVNKANYRFSAIRNERVGDAEASVLDVNADGVQTRWWIGADGKLLQERFTAVEDDGATTQTMKYSKWKSFSGLEYPTKYEMFSDAGPSRLSMTLAAMEVNVAVDPKVFEKPPK